MLRMTVAPRAPASPVHLFTCSPCSPVHLFTLFTRSPVHPPVTRSPVHPFTRSPVHPFTRSPVHPFTRSPVHPFTRSPVPVTRSPVHPSHPFTRSPAHPFPHAPSRLRAGTLLRPLGVRRGPPPLRLGRGGVAMSELLELADPEARELWEGLSLGYTESRRAPAPARGDRRRSTRASRRRTCSCSPGRRRRSSPTSTSRCGPGDHAMVDLAGVPVAPRGGARGGRRGGPPRPRPAAGWALDLDELRRSLRPGTRALVVNFPHNPTGALPAPATFRALAEIGRGGAGRSSSPTRSTASSSTTPRTASPPGPTPRRAG